MLVRRGTDGFRCRECRREASRAPPAGQARPGRRRPAGLRALRLRALAGGAALPPRRPGGEVLRARATRGHAIADRRPRGGGASASCSARTVMRRWRPGSRRPIGPTMSTSPRPRTHRSGVAQSAEHSAVNRRVVGSSPTPGAPAPRAGRRRLARGGRSLRLGTAAATRRSRLRRARFTPRTRLRVSGGPRALGARAAARRAPSQSCAGRCAVTRSGAPAPPTLQTRSDGAGRD